jgi:hypothetical protein
MRIAQSSFNAIKHERLKGINKVSINKTDSQEKD